MKNKNIIFITGSTCSSVGKGTILASIGKLLELIDLNMAIVKIDPYLNQDAGTMNPNEHGEVWVTKKGQETDLDGGTYFRFLNKSEDNHLLITAGNIYQEVFKKERKGFYNGETVRINPHITNEIIEKILNIKEDMVLVEIGGTIGELELEPFLIVIKKLQNNSQVKVMHIHISPSFELLTNKDIKLKPIENAFNLFSYGIKIDLCIIRSSRNLTLKEKEKIYNYSFVSNVIDLIYTSSIYEIPLILYEKNLHKIIYKYFFQEDYKKELDLEVFKNLLEIKNNQIIPIIKVLIIGKYVSKIDNYKSIDEALLHAATYLKKKFQLFFFDLKEPSEKIKDYDVVIVAGGFGINYTEEIISHIRYIRQNNIPVLLICFGLQLALIEMGRNLLKISDATSVEFQENGTPIICLVDESHNPITNNFGGTLRTGEFPVYLNKTSFLNHFYDETKRIKNQIFLEKFRHRYWINKNFKEKFEKIGVHFSITGVNKFNELFGFELDENMHQFFVGVQFHPELSSSLYTPHPLFISLLSKVKK